MDSLSESIRNERLFDSCWIVGSIRLADLTVHCFVSAVVVLALFGNSSLAQDAAPAEPPVLAAKQNEVADRYRRLEELLLRLADVEADENPERAALLRRAARQSRETFVLEKLVAASQSLKTEQFAKAIDSQASAKEGLDKLLTLLLSEDRPQRIRDEKKRIANMIKELKVVERLQRSTRARTENGAELREVADEQSQIGDRSEKVNDDMKSDEPKDKSDPTDQPDQPDPTDPSNPTDPTDQPEAKPTEAKPSEAKPTEAKPSESKPAPGEPQPSEPQPDEPQPGEPQPGEPQPGKPQPGEPKPGEPQPGEPPAGQQEAKPQQPESPEDEAKSQLNEAIKQMRQAEKELDDSKRDKAIEKQSEAEQNLRAAIDRLEKILRQLREEEMQRELARLESRLRKMAQMQGKVLDDTKSLAAVPVAQRDRQTELKAGNLAFEEKKIVIEADRAMLLLREEGTSVAFPEVMSQIRDDMQRVAERFTATKIDEVTTGIQSDILAALEEMIGALQQAQRDLEKKKQEESEGGQQSGGEQKEQPLIEQIAELKLIRTMETRIKSTTERYGTIIDQGPSEADDLLGLLQDLSGRQSNLYRITRDLVLKRNQ